MRCSSRCCPILSIFLEMECTTFCSFWRRASSSARSWSFLRRRFRTTMVTQDTTATRGTAVETVAMSRICPSESEASPLASIREAAAAADSVALSERWHRVPANPRGQMHLNSLTRSTQVAPLRQGEVAHSLTSTLQSLPANPGRHVHR